MPVVVLASPDDEIADLIELVRSARDAEVGLVVPPGSTALQTPLNARLLSQFSRQNGRRTAIVSADPRVQELARTNGFTVYASVPAYERGIEAAVPRAPVTGVSGNGAGAAGAAMTAAAVGVQPPPAAPVAPPAPPRRPLPGAPGTASPSRRNRRPLYFAAGAVAVVGLLLFLLLAPSATISVTLAGTPLSVNPTIQGSTDPSQASQGDHILTSVAQSTAMSTFTATPSGTQTIPAAPATGTETIAYNQPSGAQFWLCPSNGPPPQCSSTSGADSFQTGDASHSLTFVVTQATFICIPPSGAPAGTQCYYNGQPYPANSSAPIQDATAEAKGNVGANSITYWPQDPCLPANYQPNPRPSGCGASGSDPFSVTNSQATSGGADSKQQTVASANDVSTWNNQVTQIENTLTAQINSQLQSQAAGRLFAVDPGGNGKSLSFAVSPQIPSANAAFATAQITVTGTGKAATYSPNDIKADVLADLKAQVSQGDQLAPNSLVLQPCQVTQAGSDGTVILSCTATDFSQPIVDLEGLKSQLAGKNPGDANKIIQSKVDRVQDVKVSEFPFGLFYLPFFSSRISIDEQFVSQPASR